MFANFYQVPAALSKLTRFTRGNFVTQIGKNLVHIAARGIKRLHKLGRLQAGVKTARSHVVFLGCIKTSWDLSFCQVRKLCAVSWSKAQEAQLEIAGRAVDKSFLLLILLIEWISQLLRVTLTLKHSDVSDVTDVLQFASSQWLRASMKSPGNLQSQAGQADGGGAASDIGGGELDLRQHPAPSMTVTCFHSFQLKSDWQLVDKCWI